MEHSPEDCHKCSACDDKLSVFHCNTCRLNICQECVGEHVTSQLTIPHTFVSLQIKEKEIRNPACSSHVGFKCDIFCVNCIKPVCSQCFADSHKDHRVRNILEIYQEKFQDVKDDNGQLQEKIIPKYVKMISLVKNQTSECNSEYQSLRNNLYEQGTKWHKTIDEVIKQNETKINKMEEFDVASLNQHISDLESQLSILLQTTQENMKILNSSDGCQILNFGSKISEINVPARLQLNFPTFIPHTVQQANVCTQFGVLNASSIDYIREDAEKKILGKSEVIFSTLARYKHIRAIHCVGSTEAWVIDNSKELKLIDIHGSIKRKVKVTCGHIPYDLTTSKGGELIFTDSYGNKSLNVAVHDKSQPLLQLQDWRPKGVCTTLDDGILVCMSKEDSKESKVVRFSRSVIKQEIQYDETGASLYKAGFGNLFITENKNTDIWVSDESAKALVVTNRSGRFRFRYVGQMSSKKYKTFEPWRVDSDSQFHVVVVDIANKIIHLINENGYLMRYIDDWEMDYPYGICVDDLNRLWICEYNSMKLKVMKYIA